MALDLAEFMKQRGLSSGVNLVGHSMCVGLFGWSDEARKLIRRGGKAVMAYALNEELRTPLRSLVSVDMSPAVGKISPE